MNISTKSILMVGLVEVILLTLVLFGFMMLRHQPNNTLSPESSGVAQPSQ